MFPMTSTVQIVHLLLYGQNLFVSNKNMKCEFIQWEETLNHANILYAMDVISNLSLMNKPQEKAS